MGYNKNNKVKQEHKRIRSILYKMHDRCENSKHPSYKYYGGKGIKVCDEWEYNKDGIDNFIKWSVQNGYDENLEIDRINNNEDYCPDNCRWISHKMNCNNKSNNRSFEYNDKTYTVSEFSEEFDINRNTVTERLNNNISDLVDYQKSYQYLKRKVYQFTKDKHFIKEYESITECAKQLNTHEVCISRVCNGHRKTHRGFIFSFNREGINEDYE